MTNDDKKRETAVDWAIDDHSNPSLASADWLAADIDPDRASVEALLADPTTPLRTLRTAKNVFKTMRLVGETARDRRVGAHCYLAAIASGMTHHGTRISTQSDAALIRGLEQLSCQLDMPEKIRTLASLTYRSLLETSKGSPQSSLSSFLTDDDLEDAPAEPGRAVELG